MAFRKKGLASYGEVEVKSGTAYADSVQLIQMLFDGLIDSLAAAEGQIERNEIQAKGESLSRATRIVLGLQGSLDMEKGGEIAGYFTTKERVSRSCAPPPFMGWW